MKDKIPHTHAKQVETKLTRVSLRTDGILEIRFKMDEYEVDVEDQLEIMRAVENISQDGSYAYPILVVPGLYGGITPEARSMEMFTQKAFQTQKALAIVVHALHQRILGKLYIAQKKNKPTYPYSLFPSETAALTWLANL